MIDIRENFSLKNLNTFAVEAKAKYFVEVRCNQELEDLFNTHKEKIANRLVLGGGSNILFTQNFEGLVIKINFKGITHLIENNDVFVTAGSGEVWQELVNYCVDHDFAGIENLSLIPGSVGASPVQNIGAYGVEIKDVFYSCQAFDTETQDFRTFSREECKFSYRDSIFKSTEKGKYIITQVTFKLSLCQNLNLSYGAIQQELEKRGIATPTIKQVSEVVSHIRVSKLPDPSSIGNAGSFFKNPVVDFTKFRQLESFFPDIVYFPAPNNKIKLAAGWLIEQCGFKGKVHGQTGTWKNQALVLVNHGQATGNEVFNFSQLIIDTVNNRFGIVLEREVNII